MDREDSGPIPSHGATDRLAGPFVGPHGLHGPHLLPPIAPAAPDGEAPGRWGEEVGAKLDFLWRVHSVQLDAIRLADAKAAASLAVASGAVGWAVRDAFATLPRQTPAGGLAVGLPLALCCLAYLLTVGSSLLAIHPRLARGRSDSGVGGVDPPARRPGGFIFYGAVARNPDAAAAVARYAGATREDLADDLAGDVWCLATLAVRKYPWAGRAVRGAILCVLGSISTLLALSLFPSR